MKQQIFQVLKSDMATTEVVFKCGKEEKHFYDRPHGKWDYTNKATVCSECGEKAWCKEYGG